TVDLRGVTKADLKTRPQLTEDVILLWGIDPTEFLKKRTSAQTKRKEHQSFDVQSLNDDQVRAELLETYPEIIQRTIDELEGRISQKDTGEKKELQEWKYILESMSFQRLKKFLRSGSERATRLRQSLPFWPVLTDHEQDQLQEIQSRQEPN